jgi:hypothetical protein
MDPFKPIYEILSNRFPIRLEIGATGVDPKFLYVEITNQTTSIPVCVRKVRIHFGNQQSSCALHLEPFEEVKIAPKERKQFLLKYNNNKVSRRYLTPHRPTPREDNSGPGFDSPANLFNAIGHGNPEDSWLEIDFNEFDDRVFLKGKIQPMIDSIGCYTRDLRNKKAKTIS